MEMEIVDSQVVEPEPLRGWPDGMSQAHRDACAVELALATMDAAGVDAGVIHGAPSSFIELAIERYPAHFAGCMVVSPDTPDVVEVVSGLRRRSRDRFAPGWVGIRLVLAWPPGSGALERLHAGGYEPILDAAERNHVPTCVFLSGHIGEATAIAEAHPDLVMIIDHFGLPAPPMMHRDHPPFRDLDVLVDLARHPNVAVKFSGAPALSIETYPFDDLWPSLHRVVEAFGPERLMWGGDFPRCKGLHSYAEAVGYLKYTNELSRRDKELLFGVTLRRIMRWPRRQ